jgi:hypothetical protein
MLILFIVIVIVEQAGKPVFFLIKHFLVGNLTTGEDTTVNI